MNSLGSISIYSPFIRRSYSHQRVEIRLAHLELRIRLKIGAFRSQLVRPGAVSGLAHDAGAIEIAVLGLGAKSADLVANRGRLPDGLARTAHAAFVVELLERGGLDEGVDARDADFFGGG